MKRMTFTQHFTHAVPVAILFSCLALGSGNLLGQCQTGSLILDSSGNFAGCAYSTWGSSEQSECNYLQSKGATLFAPTSAGCHLCVMPPHNLQVAKDDYTGLTLTPRGSPDAPTTFRCLKCVT